MKYLYLICRILLGLMFVVFGANLLHPFMPMQAPPAGSPPDQFMGVMAPSGWMHHVGFFQLLGGLLVLIGGTAPLGLCILGPVIVNILTFHLLLAGGHGIGPGPLRRPARNHPDLRVSLPLRRHLHLQGHTHPLGARLDDNWRCSPGYLSSDVCVIRYRS